MICSCTSLPKTYLKIKHVNFFFGSTNEVVHTNLSRTYTAAPHQVTHSVCLVQRWAYCLRQNIEMINRFWSRYIDRPWLELQGCKIQDSVGFRFFRVLKYRFWIQYQIWRWNTHNVLKIPHDPHLFAQSTQKCSPHFTSCLPADFQNGSNSQKGFV